MGVWPRHKSFPIPSTNISSTPDPVCSNSVTMRGTRKREVEREREEACLHSEDDDAIHLLHSTLVSVKL